MKKIGIYPGTFDPITYGHIDVIKKSLKIVNKLIIAVSNDFTKDYLFSSEERVSIIKKSLFIDLKFNKKNLSVLPFNTLTTTFCIKHNSAIIFRGLRAVSDFEYEFQLAGMNRQLNKKIETVFLMSDPDKQIISSKFVKEIAKLNGNIDNFVTKSTKKSIRDKYVKKIFIILFFYFFTNLTLAKDSIMILKLKDGDVEIELYNDIAPKHVERIKKLASEKKYDGVVFHRVIDGFMAQTGDVQFGNSNSENYSLNRAGTGGSEYPDLKAEFSDIPHERGTLSMARSSSPDSANSQFFICFKKASHLDRQYTVFGKVIKGMELIDQIKKGEGSNGQVSDPADKIISLYIN